MLVIIIYFMSKSLFIGRWQPFHEGHQTLIDSVLKEGGKVVIAIRDTPISESNPYTVSDRKKKNCGILQRK